MGGDQWMVAGWVREWRWWGKEEERVLPKSAVPVQHCLGQPYAFSFSHFPKGEEALLEMEALNQGAPCFLPPFLDDFRAREGDLVTFIYHWPDMFGAQSSNIGWMASWETEEWGRVSGAVWGAHLTLWESGNLVLQDWSKSAYCSHHSLCSFIQTSNFCWAPARPWGHRYLQNIASMSTLKSKQGELIITHPVVTIYQVLF